MVQVLWTGLNGLSRGISVPVEEYEQIKEEGAGFHIGIAEYTLEPSVLKDPKYGPETGDMLAVPDVESESPLEWQKDTKAVFTDLTTVSGDPVDLCTRSVLRDVVSEFESMGYYPSVGVEMEFSLFDGAIDTNEPYDDASSYEMVPVDQSQSLIRQWIAAMRTAGFDIIGVHKESQPGQYEVKLRHDDAVRAADAVMFFRYMMRSVSASAAYTASFMPRPYSNEDSNGMHFHISLWDQDHEHNRFAGDDRYLDFPAGQHPHDAGLSDDAYHFAGGILDHTKGLTAVCAPTVNSYKRLHPGHFAPVNIAWGPDNRTTSLRIPPELDSSTRIEHRIPDTSSNPYLAIAATLAAGLDGLRRDAEPIEPVTTSAYEGDFDRLPQTLIGAVEELQSDHILVDALGEDLVEEFAKIKRDEFNRYQQHVSDWERSQYDNVF